MIARIAARPARVIPARAVGVRFYAENQFGWVQLGLGSWSTLTSL